MNQNPDQAEAIRHGAGPMLVLAGPGSGKTHVIISRVRHLIEQRHVRPDNILVITFSKAAASEMRERFLKQPGISYPDVTFGTFHACFFHILQIAYDMTPSNIMTEDAARRLLRDILLSLQPELAEEPEMLIGIREEIQRYKSTLAPGDMLTSEDYEPLSCSRELFYPLLRQYMALTEARKLVDFEDMLSKTYELFRKRPDLLSYWQERYRYILIDEFQDINPLQYAVIRQLAAAHGNLFVVGDDDQSIYGFRGAAPEIMLRFPTDYPNASVVRLSVNYRCSSEILHASTNLIRCNTNRYEKYLTAARGPVTPVQFHTYEGIGEEYDAIASKIRRLLESGCAPEEVAVLFRTNLEMRGLVQRLTREAIPFRCHVTPPDICENPYVQPILSYLRIASGSKDRSDWLSIINKPVRYVERAVFSERTVDLSSVFEALRRKGKKHIYERVQKLSLDLKRLSTMNPYAAIHFIRHIIGYNRYLTDLLSDETEAMDVLDELMLYAKDYPTIGSFLASIEDTRRRRTVPETPARGVSLLTFHRSKGLEFSHVILCDCNELITPHKKALLPDQIAEERRLFYVAMTRAKCTLHICYVRKRLSHELKPSRFLGEIRLPADALLPGTEVYHTVHGLGTLLSVAGDRLRVRFAGHLLARELSLSAVRADGTLMLQAYCSSGNSSSRSS